MVGLDTIGLALEGGHVCRSSSNEGHQFVSPDRLGEESAKCLGLKVE